MLSHYRTHHQLAENTIQRLFYPEHPLSVKTDYIHLAMTGGQAFQAQLDKMRTLRRGGSTVDEESQRHYLNELHAHSHHTVEINSLLPSCSADLTKPLDPCKALITGTAGIGKTTLSHYLVHLWAQGKWGTQFSWVFRIALRELMSITYPFIQEETHFGLSEVPALIRLACMGTWEATLSPAEKAALDVAIDNALKAHRTYAKPSISTLGAFNS